LQSAATRCATLQHAVQHCNTVRYIATRCAASQHGGLHRNTVGCIATRWAALQHGALHCNTVGCIATRWAALQHGGLHCNTVGCIATRWAALQHGGLRRNTADSVALQPQRPPLASKASHLQFGDFIYLSTQVGQRRPAPPSLARLFVCLSVRAWIGADWLCTSARSHSLRARAHACVRAASQRRCELGDDVRLRRRILGEQRRCPLSASPPSAFPLTPSAPT
jgi:hypothetical protein